MSRLPAWVVSALVFGLIVGLLPGCYGHHRHRPPPTGALEVANAATSIEAIEFVRVEEIHGPILDSLNVIVPPGERVIVSSLPPASYAVTIVWTDGRRDVISPVDVFSAQTAFLEVVNRVPPCPDRARSATTK